MKILKLISKWPLSKVELGEITGRKYILRTYPHRQALQVIIPQAKCSIAR